MLRFSCGIVALVVAGMGILSAVAADKPGQTIPGFGTVVDPDGDCRFADRVKLTIRVPNTLHGLTYRPEPGQSKLNAPRLLQDVKGDFQFAIKVQAFPITATKASTSGRHAHLSAGLIVWHDDRNFMRIERAASGGPPAPFVFVERFEDGQSAWQKKLPIENKDTYLRVMRTDNTFTFENSADGQDWNKIHTEDAKYPEQIKTGIHVINSSIEVFAPTIEVPASVAVEGSSAASGTPDKPTQVVRTLTAAVDPDGDCQFTAEPEVTITVPGTNHDLARTSSNVKQNAPRVLDDIKGDFQLAVKVSAFPTPNPATSNNNLSGLVGAGVLVWQDGQNYIRLERVAEGNAASQVVLLKAVIGGEEVNSERRTSMMAIRTCASGEGNAFTFETGAVGSNWTKLKTLDLKFPEKVKAGVAAINTTTNEFSATIEVPPASEAEK